VNIRESRPARRGQSLSSRGIFGLGSATAFALWYVLSSVNEMGAILVPATLLSTLVTCVILYTRIRARQRWQAAWESYAKVDLSRNSFKSVEDERTCSLVGTN
jgi:hypothetical protein